MQTVQRINVASSVAVTLTLACTSTALADTKVETTFSATPYVTYSDNICLRENDKKDGWITGLTPFASITGDSRKTEFSVRGSVNLNSLTNSALNSKGCTGNYDDRNQYNPSLYADLNTVLVDNLLNLDVRGRIGRNEVSTRFRGGDDEFDRTGRGNTFYRYSVSPYINRRFKDIATMNLRYTYDQVINDNELATDSVRHAGIVTFKNARPSNWSRSFTARTSVLKYDENFLGVTRDDSEFSSVRLGLGYRFNNRISVNGNIGHEWNNFQTLFPRDKDGNAWQVSLNWTPTPRTTVQVGQGDRFFGNTPRVLIEHSHKRNFFNARYARELNFRRDLTTEDLEGFPLDIENTTNPALYSEAPIIDERLTAGWAYRGKRSTLSLTGNYSEQRRTEDGQEAIYKNVRLSYDPQLPGAYNLTGYVSWREDEPRAPLLELIPIVDDDGTSQAWVYSLTGSRKLGQRFRIALTYRFTDREGSTTRSSYQENRITASFGIRF